MIGERYRGMTCNMMRDGRLDEANIVNRRFEKFMLSNNEEMIDRNE